MAEPVLALSGITKRFGALVANDAITLQLHAGEVLALLGDIGLGQTILAVPRDSDIPGALTSLPRFRIAGGRMDAGATT